MTATWDGRPQNPEQSGMHLLRARLTSHLTGWYWNATTERFHHEHITLGRAASLERYVYECPVLTTDEVDARVAEGRHIWRPIGTAPLNGTEILVWDSMRFADVAYWDPLSLRWTNGDHQLTPTHWMPLPEPPK